jgi:membrane protein YqaA with SNARE-associated domain
MDLALLFFSALAASTILPMSSEIVLGALASAGATDVWLLLAVATAGNTLGAVVNWGIGPYASTWRTRLHSLEEAKFERASRWFNRWGIWCLLLSWLPVVGDPLTLVAGALRTAFVPFVLLVLLGKAARYLFVLLIVA